MVHDIAQPPLEAAQRLSGNRVFMTGATGMVGATLARVLLAAGVKVHALVRNDSSFWRIADIADDIELYIGDVTDTESLERATAASEPDIIFHLATTRTDPGAARSVNVGGLRNLLDATRELDYKRFVVASSSLVCRKQREPLREDCDVAPIGFFAESKANAESAATEFAAATGKPLAILRIFSVYGEWENPDRLIPTAIRAALLGIPIGLTAPGFRRDLVYVYDVAEALCRAGSSATIPPGQIINVGTGVETANEETVRLIEEACGRRIEIADGNYPPRETDSSHWSADPSKARHALGWEARTSVRDGIQRTVDWMRPRVLRHAQVGAQ